MSYLAKNLDEIAVLFESLALSAETRGEASTDGIYRTVSQGQASGFRQAANILRCVTLTEPCHMESDAYTARRNA